MCINHDECFPLSNGSSGCATATDNSPRPHNKFCGIASFSLFVWFRWFAIWKSSIFSPLNLCNCKCADVRPLWRLQCVHVKVFISSIHFSVIFFLSPAVESTCTHTQTQTHNLTSDDGMALENMAVSFSSWRSAAVLFSSERVKEMEKENSIINNL